MQQLIAMNGLPYYHPPPYATPPHETSKTLLMTSKIIPPSLSPITLTPPLSPNLNLGTTTNVGDQSRRGSVIMKVENCQILPANETQISIEHVCRWENCYKFFDSLEKLANHVSIMHSTVAPDNLYYCKWEGCLRTDRGFNARYKMLVHCRTHTKEKPHRCSFENCGKSFSRAENLKIHIRSHTLEKPYRCNFPGCTKAYSNSSDRFKHSRTHQNTKPYYCKINGCHKRYTDPSSLRKHVKTFNHENLIQQQYELKCNEGIDSDEVSHKIETMYYHEEDNHKMNYEEHLEDNKYSFYDDNGRLRQWTDNSDLTVRIETINLNEMPLDLSIRHNR
ncbi:zinc finger protein GLIS2 homolog isoform X2 [Chironomus tepperi]|uniref:zinc finger protein GLIS2 homolog isoform X2 n=1 Tax=Chironomus tepperi TaxID=113505 RepID=UPI00391F4C47